MVGLNGLGMGEDELRGKSYGTVELKPSTSSQGHNSQEKWIKLPPSSSLLKEDKEELLGERHIKDECLGASSRVKEKVERAVEQGESGQVDTENANAVPSEMMTVMKEKVPENGCADAGSGMENSAPIASLPRTCPSGRPSRKYQKRTYEVGEGYKPNMFW